MFLCITDQLLCSSEREIFPSKSARDNGFPLVLWRPGWPSLLLHMATLSHLCPFTLMVQYNWFWGYERTKLNDSSSSSLGFTRYSFQDPSVGFLLNQGSSLFCVEICIGLLTPQNPRMKSFKMVEPNVRFPTTKGKGPIPFMIFTCLCQLCH